MSAPTTPTRTTRRGFLKAGASAGGGLLVAFSLGRTLSARPAASAAFEPNAFLRITADGAIRFYAKHDEMGQGIHTGLAIAVAEELEVDVSEIEGAARAPGARSTRCASRARPPARCSSRPQRRAGA